MILHLSELPPPLYACFTNVRRNGRAKTARYKAWIKLAAAELGGSSCVSGGCPDIAVTYSLVKPDKRRRDLGNLEKGLSDILVSTGVIEDDSQIVDLRLVWVESECPVTIEIREMTK